MFYAPARQSLRLALPAAIGISSWLQWGMQEQSGVFEAELRSALRELNSWVGEFPKLPFYDVLKPYLAKWNANVDKISTMASKLEDVAVESRDPAEWYAALRNALRTIQSLDGTFYAYHAAARDLTADLTEHYAALVAAMRLVTGSLDQIGPRFLYVFDDDDEVDWLVEGIPNSFAQCAGNLPNWRHYDVSPKPIQQQGLAKPPSILWEAWYPVLRLGELIDDVLRESVCIAPGDTCKVALGPTLGTPTADSLRAPVDQPNVVGVAHSAEEAIRVLGIDRATIRQLAKLTGRTESAIRSSIHRAIAVDENLKTYHIYPIPNAAPNTAKLTYGIRAFWRYLKPDPERSQTK